MKFLGYDNVLCISPHPDDTEYSMMGTVLKYSDTIFTCLQLCQGGDMDVTTGKSRLLEVESVWKEAECSNVNLLFTEAKYMRDMLEEEWINFIEKKLSPSLDAIVLPNEYDSHFEHRLVAGFGKALIRQRPITLIQYKTPSTDQTWVPNLFVDIEEEYDIKVNALKKFVSQEHRYYFRDDVLRSFHSDFQSAKKAKHYVEQFKILDLYL
jgi:LmbE family N-acetylglucosaminyl deacetylase|tara:strand:- start:1887 stop:2513 length:627 start_codon:yes stop_codon:yes gene_type:complete